MQNLIDSAIAMTDGQRLVLSLEIFLEENYEIRHNIINDVMEFRRITQDAPDTRWHLLDDQAFNTIVVEARRSGIEGAVRQVLTEIIFSANVVQYNPVKDYLDNLPKWDGVDRMEQLFTSIPGITAETIYYACKWFRSCIAHWYGMDKMFGNQTVLTLIGEQGCGKSTFAQRLIPPALREYYLDHINLSNKFDKEMALTANMIVNIDELDQISASQQAALKQVLTKSRVNGRKIYGRNQVLRERLASFVATTNNNHPLKDPTGSRRFLCVKVPKGCIINNELDINYDQLYSQALHEVRDEQMAYWFNNDEVRRIQVINTQFYANVNLEDIVSSLFKKPEGEDESRTMSSTQILTMISNEYPSVSSTKSIQTQLGIILGQMGIVRKHTNKGNMYEIAVRQSA